MANLGIPFDATSVEPAQTLEVLPPGKYTAQIVDSDMRLTKDGTGQYLWLSLDVLDGSYKGRKLFDRLNLVNANPQTVAIAQSALSAICHATGCLQVEDSQDLHLIPLTLVVQVQPPKNGYGESNKVRYLPIETAAKPAPQQPARSAAPQAAPMVATPQPRAAAFDAAPWKRPA